MGCSGVFLLLPGGSQWTSGSIQFKTPLNEESHTQFYSLLKRLIASDERGQYGQKLVSVNKYHN